MLNKKSAFLNAVANHLLFYPTPVNVTYAWSFGSLAGLFFSIQIITGIFLAMHYIPHTNEAFDSIIHIMQNVNNGWLIRYAHANGASMIFILMYIHIGRGIYYESYKHRREILWWTGLLIFILMMATAFIGYVLPWGQMSFWGATVITSLVTAVPFVGDNIAHWLWGGFSVGDATLTRFYSIHYTLPFIIIAIVCTHLIILHQEASTNPLQITIGDKISFYPYFFWKDLFAFNVCLLLYTYLIFFNPNLLGHPDNWIRANPLVTPEHIVPEWYFQPFYAILRSCPSKLGGVVSMGASLLILFILPLYRTIRNPISSNMSPLFRISFWIFVFTFVFLMYLGGQPAVTPYVGASQIFTVYYFFFFLIVVPFRNHIERYAYPQITNEEKNLLVIRTFYYFFLNSVYFLYYNYN